jgi:hypothetical protein
MAKKKQQKASTKKKPATPPISRARMSARRASHGQRGRR